jgi:hypothetical protein
MAARHCRLSVSATAENNAVHLTGAGLAGARSASLGRQGGITRSRSSPSARIHADRAGGCARSSTFNRPASSRSRKPRRQTTATARLETLGREIDRSAVNSPLGGISATTTLQKAWETHGLEWRRQQLNIVIDKIVYTAKAETSGYRPPKYARWIFDPNLIEIRWRF